MIYKNDNCKNKSSIKEDNKKFCTDAIAGQIETSDHSDYNITGDGDQYTLVSSDEKHCVYQVGVKVKRTFTFGYDRGYINSSCKEEKLANNDTKTRACGFSNKDKYQDAFKDKESGNFKCFKKNLCKCSFKKQGW